SVTHRLHPSATPKSRLWESRNLDLAISELFLSLLFGVAEGCNLWVTEVRAWHHHVVTQFLGFCTSDGFCRNNALSLSNVCELQLSSDVTDSVDTVNIRAHPVINVDSATLGQLHAGVF